MKALTLHQPWASAIAVGLKRYETRSWSTSYRGPLAIHAGKSVPACAREDFEDAPAVIARPMPLGAVVCVVELVACHRTEERASAVSFEERGWGNWSPGRFAWELANIRRLPEPITARGAQGLWEWHEAPAAPATGPRVLNKRHDGVPPGAVYVGRPTKWGNPFGLADGTREDVIARFREHLLGSPDLLAALPELRGRDLVCWCAPLPCHADVLLELSNAASAAKAAACPAT